MQAMNTITNDPHSSRSRIESRPGAVTVFGCNGPEALAPVTAAGSRRRAQKRAAISTARTPMTTCICAAVGLLTVEIATRSTGSARSRRNSSTTNATVMPAVMPPSQKTNKLSTGRGRESNRVVIPTRTGSIATTSDRKKTALHMFVTSAGVGQTLGRRR